MPVTKNRIMQASETTPSVTSESVVEDEQRNGSAYKIRTATVRGILGERLWSRDLFPNVGKPTLLLSKHTLMLDCSAVKSVN